MSEASRHFISIRQNEYMELHLIVEDGQILCAGIVNRKTGYVWENPGRRVPLLTIPGFDFRGAAVSVGPQGDLLVLEKDGRTVSVALKQNGITVDEKNLRVGLREMRLVRKADGYGESFYHEINGVDLFAMGADYVPEDNILSRVTEERTRKLLTHCKECHFNAIRV